MIKFIHLLALSTLLFQIHSVEAQNTPAKKELYTIGYFNSAPLSFLDTDLQQANGFAVEIMNQVAVLNDFEIKWYYDDFPILLDLLKTKKIDALINVGYSDERAEYMSYSEVNFANVWGTGLSAY